MLCMPRISTEKFFEEPKYFENLFSLSNLNPFFLKTRTAPLLGPLDKRIDVTAMYYIDETKSQQISLPKEYKWWSIWDIPLLAYDHGAILCEALSIWFKGLSLHKNYEVLTPYIDLKNHHTICFYGGSFNPIHEGHIECLRQLKQHFPDIPSISFADNNPFKDNKYISCYWKYFKELHKKLENLTILFPGFTGMESKNPSILWIEQLALNYPKMRIQLLMGDDSFRSINNWIRYSELISKIDTIYVVPRTNDEIVTNIELCKKINPSLNILKLNSHPFQNLSSTAERSQKD